LDFDFQPKEFRAALNSGRSQGFKTIKRQISSVRNEPPNRSFK